MGVYDMQISKIIIQNFRGIESENIELKNLNIIIGNNGTSKTTILEALHYALSPAYVQNHISYNDFYNNTNSPILIEVYFSEIINIDVQFGYQTKQIPFKKIWLTIRKRENQIGLKKAFNSGFVITHCLVPDYENLKEGKGWNVRDTSGALLTVTTLQAKEAINSLPIKGFYFNKDREKQLNKGFNSSISAVFEDFNWRFLLNTQKEPNNFFDDKKKLEQYVLDNIAGNIWDKSIGTTNNKIQTYFSLKPFNISLIDCNNPFNSAFLANQEYNQDLPISKLGSGIEMIISLIFLETIASLSKNKLIIIVDEPEVHLHPTLQKQLLKYLQKLANDSDVQILFSTHSPYMFKDCVENATTSLISREKNYQESIFPWGKTWGELNYFSYNMATVEFFNELFGFIQNNRNLTETDEFLNQCGIERTKIWKRTQTQEFNCTLPIYVRNSIHHPENTLNKKYTDDELSNCIKILVDIVKK